MQKTVLYLRHGLSTANADRNLLSGVGDADLTEAGRTQCVRAAKDLAHLPVQAVYASPLRRARESARLLFPQQSSIPTSKALLEFDYGDFEGVAIDELPSDDPVAAAWRLTPGDLTFPNGDNAREFAENSEAAIHRLLQDEASETIALVAHRTLGRILVARSIGLDLNHFRKIPMDNCSLTLFTWTREAGLELQSLNVSPCGLLPGAGE